MYFTEEQILVANELNLERFLINQGEEVKKSGKEVRWMRFDSVTVKENKWYRHSQSKGGYPVQFLREFYGMEFLEAIAFLLNEQGINLKDKISLKNLKKENKMENKVKEKKPFKLPKKINSTQNIYNYLVNKRFIDKEVVDYFVKENMIYENYYGSIVFVAYDENKIPKYAQIKILEDRKHNSIVVESSDYKEGFKYLGNNDNLYVFESHIDLLSYITLNKESWRENSYISLSGVNPNMLLGLLERRKYSKIYMCLDNDKAGIEASYKIAEELKSIYEDIKVYLKIPEEKDYNETLKKLNGVEYIQKKGHPKIEFCRNMIVGYVSKYLDLKYERLDELKVYRKIYKIFNEKEMLPLNLNEETLFFLYEKIDESVEDIYKVIKQNSSLKTEEIFLKAYSICNPIKDVGNSEERIKLIENQIVEIGKGFKNKINIEELEEKQINLIKNLIQFSGFLLDEFELSFKNKEEENEQTKLSIKM